MKVKKGKILLCVINRKVGNINSMLCFKVFKEILPVPASVFVLLYNVKRPSLIKVCNIQKREVPHFNRFIHSIPS